ncbi:MFS transporter [Streptomyces odontomachi]|uniref:MFS transporter n=1 Tax=Streptomyces odontomachi TaxID=2944940 RepID=UPI00210D93F0|nr:MFS transporter [Streptomyces sp. ODS25]
MRWRYALPCYLAGAVAARTGDEMSRPALLLAGFAVTGSAAEASALLAAVTVSAAVGGPVLGALLDRSGQPGRLLAGALVGYAVGLGLILAGLGRLPSAATLLIAVVTGLLGPALSGGWTAQVPRMAPGDHLPRANALDALTFGVASLAGPALAGGTAEAVGAPSAVLVSAVLVGLALPAAWLLPTGPGRGRGARTTSVIGDLAAGTRAIVGKPALARATLASVGCCTAEGMLTVCVPLLGERVLGGADRGAVLLSCVALAALVANAVLARFPSSVAPDTIIWTGALVQAAALALAVSARPAVVIVAALAVGIGQGPQLAAVFAVRHREAPENLRGQIFTSGASVKITGFAVGAALAGPLATRSLPAALTCAAMTAALAALAFFAVPSRTCGGTSGPRAC